MARPRRTTAPAPAPAPAGTAAVPGHPTRTRRRREPALPVSPPRPAPGAGPGRAGFVLYVGLGEPEQGGAGDTAQLAEVAEALRDLAQDLLPAAETFTALSLVPGTGADDVATLRSRLTALRPLADGPAPTDATA